MTRDARAVRAPCPVNGRRAHVLGVRALAFALGGVVVLGCGNDAAPTPRATAPVPPPPEPYERPEYLVISEAGVYDDVTSHAIARGFEAFTPTYPLFSDGADKRRFVSLPPGTTIDTSDMNHWSFPVGTRFVKEFWLGGTLLETRLIERYDEGPNDLFMGAFVWSEDGTDAVLAPDGAADVLGTPHDAPAQKQCTACHNGEAGRVLGFSALQLGRAGENASELTLARLGKLGKLSDAPASPVITPPGDEVTARAFGYLHANCGHCHNLHGTSWPDTQMVLRLDIEETVAEDSALYHSLVSVPAQYFRDADASLRVTPGDPEVSAVVVRMRERGNDKQMPPLATEIPDDAGIAAVSDWILALPP